jgi:hypothetical protein
MLVKPLIATVAIAVATATSAAPALAGTETLRTGAKAHSTTPPIKWTGDQLQALAEAYRAKNPGWRAPMSSGVQSPADATWTSENLDRLASSYTALNPGWTRR